MDKKFLDKVVDQIISETRIDYNELSPTLYTPFFSFFPLLYFTSSPLTLHLSFFNHCRDVYGLTTDEMNYVWDQYESMIKKYHRSNNFGGKLDL